MQNNKVVIIGGGIAGITAAIELLNFGYQVALYDRDKEKNFGGLAKESFGGMFFVDTPTQRRMGIIDNQELALDDWHSVADFEEDDTWPRAWAGAYVRNATPKVYQWLRNFGIGFFPVVHWVERGLNKRGNSVPRFHMVWGTGYELTRVLIKKLKTHPKAAENLTLHFRHRVEELLTQGQEVVGVKGVDELTNDPFEDIGDKVIVATGGIGGSIEKVKQNWYNPWGSPPEVILNGSHRYATGNMHDEVAANNGHLTHMDLHWHYAAGVHHPRPKLKAHGLSLVPPKSALWMNYRGERIGPQPLVSSFDTRFLVEQVCKQVKKYSWQIMNLKIANKELAISGAESNKAMKNKNIFGFAGNLLFGNRALVKDMLDNCIDFVAANSIEELAKEMNRLTDSEEVDVAVLKRDIEKYDAEIDKGEHAFKDEQLHLIAHARKYFGDRSRTCKFQKINDKKAYPLIAIREFILARKSLGGIQTDLQCRVLTEAGETIPGLYAVGEAAGFGGGGSHGKGALEGTFLGTCILTGRAAAYSIANKVFL